MASKHDSVRRCGAVVSADLGDSSNYSGESRSKGVTLKTDVENVSCAMTTSAW